MSTATEKYPDVKITNIKTNGPIVTQEERIKAAIALGVHKLSGLRHSALKLCLELTFGFFPEENRERISKILDRFHVEKPFAFYVERPELWGDPHSFAS